MDSVCLAVVDGCYAFHMNLDDYTPQALATAQDRAHDLEYLLPGIIGETGEFFAEFAKQHWHGTDRSETIVDEYGDIAWLTAVLLNRLGIDQAQVDASVSLLKYDTHEAAMELLLGRASNVFRSGPEQLPLRAAGLWATLAHHSEVLSGAPFEDVLGLNLGKLAKRASEGELRTHA